MDFERYDTRRYPTVGARAGYDEWAASYDDSVRDEMDLALLDRITTVRWSERSPAVDLACGTGRTAAWLRGAGVRELDGLDLSAAMLARARARGLHDRLEVGDLRRTPFADGRYALAVLSLADEHLPDLGPLYGEVHRVLAPGGLFVDLGYHPQFLMTAGMPTHFHRPGGEAVAIETHVHLLSDHVRAARSFGFDLVEMQERLVDDAFLAAKSKWAAYRGTPFSFALVWQRG